MNNNSLSSTHQALLNSLNGQSNSNLVTGNPAVSTTRKLEPYEDKLRGQSFKGKDLSNFGMIEVVDFTFEDSGKQYVTFRSGVSIPVSDLPRLFEQVDFTPNTNPNIVAGLQVEGEVPRKRRQPSQQPSIQQNPIQPYQQQIQYEPPPRKKREQFDPIFELLKKMKINPTEFQLQINLSLPLKEVFVPLNASFDDFDLKLVEFILMDDNMENFKYALRQAIRQYYGLELLPPPEEKPIQQEPIIAMDNRQLVYTEDFDDSAENTNINPYEISEEDFLKLKELEELIPLPTPEPQV